MLVEFMRMEPSDLAPFFKDYSAAAFVLLDVSSRKYTCYNAAQCARRFSPCSTFKVLNSLIALESGVIPHADYRIKWDGRRYNVAPWNRDHTLRTAFADSVFWYYQALARRVGPERMGRYVRRVGYGNEDISGGIAQFWLGSSLKISADEQVAFLDRLRRNTLPFSPRSQAVVRQMMVLSQTKDSVLRGKTGTAGNAQRTVATLGWFVGYVTNRSGAYVFATNIRNGDNPSGRTARTITEAILREMALLT